MVGVTGWWFLGKKSSSCCLPPFFTLFYTRINYIAHYQNLITKLYFWDRKLYLSFISSPGCASLFHNLMILSAGSSFLKSTESTPL